MKALFLLFGFLTLLMGLLPFLRGVSFLSFLGLIPASGNSYSIIITLIGALTVFVAIKH